MHSLGMQTGRWLIPVAVATTLITWGSHEAVASPVRSAPSASTPAEGLGACQSCGYGSVDDFLPGSRRMPVC